MEKREKIKKERKDETGAYSPSENVELEIIGIDYEFLIYGNEFNLISVGLFGVNTEIYHEFPIDANLKKKMFNDPFVKKEVIPHLEFKSSPISEIRDSIREVFLKNKRTRLVGDYTGLDYTALLLTFGGFYGFPKEIPMFIADAETIAVEIMRIKKASYADIMEGFIYKNEKPHHAYSDAKEAFERYSFLSSKLHETISHSQLHKS